MSEDNKIIVGIDVLAPMTISSKDGWSGFEVDIWNEIAKRSNMSFEFKPTPFSDMFNCLKNNTIDLAMAGVSINQKREEEIDFSYPTLSSGLRIMVANGTKLYSIFEYIKTKLFGNPKKVLLFLTLSVGLIFITANILWFSEKPFQTFAPTYLRGITQAMWVSLVTFLGLYTGGTTTMIFDVTSFIGKMILTVEHTASLLLLALIISELSAFITTRNMMTSASQTQLKGKTISTVDGTLAAKFCNDAKLTTHTVKRVGEAYELLRTGIVHAIIFDAPVLSNYANSREGSWTLLLSEIFNRQDYGFAMKQDSIYREVINQHFLAIKEDGTYNVIYKKWFGTDDAMKI